MKRFADLYRRIDQTTRTGEKVAALEDYFRTAPPADAAWAIYFLSGRRLKRAVTQTQLRQTAAAVAGYPLWLIDECYDAVGDLAETLALVLPPPRNPRDLPLHELAERYLLPLPAMGDADRRAALRAVWDELEEWPTFVFHKLLGGAFRVGVSAALVTRAMAHAAGVEPAVMAHRLTGAWSPTADDFARLLSGESRDDPAKPFPFLLAYPVEDAAGWPDLAAALGDSRNWQAEWKWDGIRCQLIRRAGEVVLWSRGESLITSTFPEIADAAAALPDGTVLDGEVLAWEGDAVLLFAELQRRLGRKEVQPTLFQPLAAVVFMAYDLLERRGVDIRGEPLRDRRAALEILINPHDGGGRVLRLSPIVTAESWDELRARQESARKVGAEGLMLKRLDAGYGVGRRKGVWWKWKVEPYTIDAVMLYAQPGHGERASLFSDYTFGVWRGAELVPIAKAYSGLSDPELREVDRWVRGHTVSRHGPVRGVEPGQVFELAFEGLRRSDRHRSGVALRFPRIARWRTDKTAAEADTLEHVERLLRQSERHGRSR